MRNIIIFLLALVTIISCKKENDDSNILEGKIKYIVVNSNNNNDTFYFYYDSTDLWLSSVKRMDDSIIYTIDKPMSGYIKVNVKNNTNSVDSVSLYKYYYTGNYIDRLYAYDDFYQQEWLVYQSYTNNGILDSLLNYPNISNIPDHIIDSVNYLNNNLTSFNLQFDFFLPPSSIYRIKENFSIEYYDYNNVTNVPLYTPMYANSEPVLIGTTYSFTDPSYFLAINGYDSYEINNKLIKKLNVVNVSNPNISGNYEYNYLFDSKNRVSKIEITTTFGSTYEGNVTYAYY